MNYLRHPVTAGLGTGIGLALLLAMLDRRLYGTLVVMPGMPLPPWLEVSIHLGISVAVALLYAGITTRLRWYGARPGLVFGAIVSLVYLPLTGMEPIPPVWLVAHLAWGWVLGVWIGGQTPA